MLPHKHPLTFVKDNQFVLLVLRVFSSRCLIYKVHTTLWRSFILPHRSFAVKHFFNLFSGVSRSRECLPYFSFALSSSRSPRQRTFICYHTLLDLSSAFFNFFVSTFAPTQLFQPCPSATAATTFDRIPWLSPIVNSFFQLSRNFFLSFFLPQDIPFYSRTAH